MNDRRNLIIAILLTAVILFGWPYVASYFFPTPPAASSSEAKAGRPTPAASITGEPSKDISVAETAEAKSVAIADALKGGQRVLIDTPKLRGSINLVGAKIDDLQLMAHRTELAKNSPPVRLFAPSGTKDAYFARFGWVGAGVNAPDDKTVWTASATKLTPEAPVTLTSTNDLGQKFEIILSIDKDYMVRAQQRFTNGGSTPAQIASFGLISRTGKPVDATTSGSFFTRIHIGPMGVFNDKANYEWNYKDVDEAPNGQTTFKTTGGWIGFTDKYWLAALIPDQKVATNTKFIAKDGRYWSQMTSASQTAVAPGQQVTTTSQLFAGAKEVEVLDRYTKGGIEQLDLSIDWGWFRPIEKLFFWILHTFFKWFGNFGLAIIGLTVVVRGLMYPVAARQFRSMAAMRAIQPKMKQIQERWKDDKPRQQQEIMKLYKDEKVNPLAGCLPILLQIPIFFALYKLLMLTIEMRHQPFVLWLKDLSAPDPATPINLFGLLPFHPPAFLAIGVLPILLGITMWAMQKLNPQPMDPAQAQVFAVMPWFLMFIMAPFAAGLQLYWVVSNIVSILQQKWLYMQHPQLKEQMAKEAADKAAAKAKA